ncbi:Mediator complex protein [Ceratobasidium theobromae]|uniref:Mediator of RNA polymerase II transcription subunit 11 n=1 Tax=Ceratobasidium theobromae TaxID=1582974 RepID=A0A5N5QK23_9AGAM|nr:Mediator complex protein [Ceratobasidium theobromae]
MNVSGQRQSSVWSSSPSAKQIHALGEVEKDIARLLHIAATGLSLLTVPQADPADPSSGDQLPDGEERAEMFVQEATKYYETLESIQKGLRKAIVNLREARISSAAIAPSNAQAALLAPGVNAESLAGDENLHYALQESLVEREAWLGLAQTLENIQNRSS